MQIRRCGSDLQFGVDQSSVSGIDARRISDDAGIGDKAEVSKQILSVISQELFKELRARLFIPFQQYDDIISQFFGIDEIEDGEQVDEELSFVVSDSSAVDLILSDIERKGVIGPSFIKIGGLDIIMTIEHHRRQ